MARSPSAALMRLSLNYHFLLILLIGLVLAACGGNEANDGKLNVVATTTQIGDFAKNIGGDRIKLTVLLKPNQDAHDFAPEPSQVRALNAADVVLRNGIGLDTFVLKSAGPSTKVTVVSGAIELRDATSEHEDEGEEDPDAAAEAAG